MIDIDFKNKMQRAQTIRENSDKLNYIKDKNGCSLKDNFSKITLLKE